MSEMQNCFNCENCMYIGEGDSMCDVDNSLVIEEFTPNDTFYWCDGKEYSEV